MTLSIAQRNAKFIHPSGAAPVLCERPQNLRKCFILKGLQTFHGFASIDKKSQV